MEALFGGLFEGLLEVLLCSLFWGLPRWGFVGLLEGLFRASLGPLFRSLAVVQALLHHPVRKGALGLDSCGFQPSP